MAPFAMHRYDELPTERSFRLLSEISTSADSCSLSCSLKTFSIGFHPSYTCLSYTWGDPLLSENGDDRYPEASNPVQLNGSGTVHVLPNLADALRQLASHNAASYIFIDALCIDQSNPRERSAQVSLMGEIYSQCEHVYIWLGKDTTGWNSMQWLHYNADLENDVFNRDGSFKYYNSPEHDLKESRQRLEKVDMTVWQEYIEFVENRSWFSRAWVFQEVALARDATVLCGPHRLTWNRIAAFSLHLRRTSHAWSLMRHSRKRNQDAIGSDIVRLALAQHNCKNGGPESSGEPDLKYILRTCHGANTPEERAYAYFIYVLETVRPYSASDPRDKIYAVIGMLNKFLPDGVKPFLKADYDQSINDTYMTATYLSLNQFSTLDMLSLVEDRSLRSQIDLPSWVPDFSVRTGCISIHGTWNFDAARGRISESPPLALNGKRLCLQGSHFDRIVEVDAYHEPTSKSWSDDSDEDRLLGLLESLYEALRVCLNLPRGSAQQQSRSRQLAQTLIMDDGDTIPEDDVDTRFYEFLIVPLAYAVNQAGNEFSQILKAFDELLTSFHRSETECKLPTMANVTSLAQQYEIPKVERSEGARRRIQQIETGRNVYHQIYILAIAMRRVFRTESGILGLGPRSTVASDEIWLLENARVPYVLRRAPLSEALKNESLTVVELVGQSYVHGHMHGEMLAHGRAGRYQSLEIV